jgi:colanic acid/amylovoran biosynthesis glycosyltransferase
MVADAPNELVLVPVLGAIRAGGSTVKLNQKYLDGALKFAEGWPGPVTSLVRVVDEPFSDFDLAEIELDSDETSTRVELRPEDPTALERRLRSAAVALGFLSPFELELERVCRRAGVPLVLTSEYSVLTELQIVAAQKLAPIRTLRRSAWTLGADAVRRYMALRVAGLQCSGTPTHDAYAPLNRNALLFFDNRVATDDVIAPEALERRLDDLESSGRVLRLFFGGRLVPMKGVMELPRVAEALKGMGQPFRLTIVGSGPQEGELRADVERRGLSGSVEICRPMDFRTGWIPKLKRECDVFVCCHPQGDPSSTYPEVMSCGVPIVGYANEALRGIVRHSGAGELAPLRQPRRLAERIVGLARDPARLAAMSWAARSFARRHTFEKTFGARTQHLIASSRLQGR